MTKPVCFNILKVQAWTLKKTHNYNQLQGSMSADYKYLHVMQISYQLSFPSQTIPDCIRYIIGFFCYFKSQTNILASY